MSDKAELIAAAQVNAFAGPPAGISFNSNFGFKTATRDSAGVYELELKDEHEQHEMVVEVSRQNGGPGSIQYGLASKRVIQVTNFDSSGNPADTVFSITVHRVRD